MSELVKNLCALCALGVFIAFLGAGGLVVADRPTVKVAEASR